MTRRKRHANSRKLVEAPSELWHMDSDLIDVDLGELGDKKRGNHILKNLSAIGKEEDFINQKFKKSASTFSKNARKINILVTPQNRYGDLKEN